MLVSEVLARLREWDFDRAATSRVNKNLTKGMVHGIIMGSLVDAPQDKPVERAFLTAWEGEKLVKNINREFPGLITHDNALLQGRSRDRQRLFKA